MPVRGRNMRKMQAEPYRDIGFLKGKRGAVIVSGPGKTKISIRLDNAVLDHFRAIAEAAGGGNYQSLINNTLAAHIHQQSLLATLRKERLLVDMGGQRIVDQRLVITAACRFGN